MLIFYFRTIDHGDTTFIVSPSELTLYPNPSEHIVTLKELDTYKEIRIIDISGREVYNWSKISSYQGSVTLDIGRLVPSLYIVSVVTYDGKIQISRFIKQ